MGGQLDYEVTLPKDVCLAPGVWLSVHAVHVTFLYCNFRLHWFDCGPTLQMQDHHCAAIYLSLK